MPTDRSTRPSRSRPRAPPQTREHDVVVAVFGPRVASRPSRFRFPGWYLCGQAVARTLGWLTSLIAIIILGYIVRQWPDKLGAVAAGIIGAGIALLTDSWEVVSIFDKASARRRRRRMATSPLKRLAFDIVSLGVTMGGIILILFDDISIKGYAFVVGNGKDGEDDATVDADDDDAMRAALTAHDGSGYTQTQMTRAGMWILAAIVAWRFIFSFWSCWDSAREFRRNERRAIRAEMAEA